MYESPITVVCGALEQKFEGDVLKCVQNVGISVNRAELIAALAYDRKQYEIGYRDGCEDGKKEIMSHFKRGCFYAVARDGNLYKIDMPIHNPNLGERIEL